MVYVAAIDAVGQPVSPKHLIIVYRSFFGSLSFLLFRVVK